MRKEIDKFVEQRLVSVVPSKRQIAHQRREFYGFVHFTVNTFTGKEWGDGTEDEAIFNPVKMDADQWCDALCAAGMKGLILTCKHHDGFCLCFVNRKSSKSEGKFPTFRSGNPHYPKDTCREFSFFSLSSRKESSIHCFLPNRVIRVRLCQRLPERFAFNVLSFDSAPAPGWRAVCFIRACSIR